MTDLNRFYRDTPALSQRDSDPDGFEWITGDDAKNSVLAFIRWDRLREAPVIVVCNFTPIVRHNYRIGVPHAGLWHEALNSDAQTYGGSGAGNFGGVESRPVASHGRADSLNLTLPPLGALFLRR
jgi:1,4-alpha-glucan branching enzyme